MKTLYYYEALTISECMLATTELTEVLTNAVKIQHKRCIRIILELPKCRQIVILLNEDNDYLVKLNDHFPFVAIANENEITKIRELIRDVVYADTEFELGVAWGRYTTR